MPRKKRKVAQKLHGEPWHQLEGEPDVSFGHFQAYLELERPRRVWEVAPIVDRSVHTVQRLATKWRWLDRAASWDAYIWEKKLNEVQKLHEKASREQMETVRKGRKLLHNRIAYWNEKIQADKERFNDITPKEAYRELERFIKLERLIFGDATERVERKWSRDTNAVDLDFSKCSSEELQQLAECIPILEKVGLIINDGSDGTTPADEGNE